MLGFCASVRDVNDRLGSVLGPMSKSNPAQKQPLSEVVVIFTVAFFVVLAHLVFFFGLAWLFGILTI